MIVSDTSVALLRVNSNGDARKVIGFPMSSKPIADGAAFPNRSMSIVPILTSDCSIVRFPPVAKKHVPGLAPVPP